MGTGGDGWGYLQGFETLQKRLHSVVFVLVLVFVPWLTVSITLVLGHVLRELLLGQRKRKRKKLKAN